jgi:Dyp-type peroxidase family
MFQLTPEARADIQGIVTSGYGHLPDTTYLFLEIYDRAKARNWLSAIVPQITTSVSWRQTPGEAKRRPPTALNVAFTVDGYRVLGLSDRALNSFSREFGFGMVERAEVLGDTGANSPQRWEFGYPQDRLHGVLLILGENEHTLEHWVEHQKRQIAAAGGIQILSEQRGHRYAAGQEQFGFHDGISQPDIKGVRKQPDPGQTTIDTGEFILGYPDAYGCLPPTVGIPKGEDPANILPPFPEQPDWHDFGRHGTYMVFRKLEQDVAGFWQLIRRTVEHTPGLPPPAAPAAKEEAMTYLASRFVGRWRSGAPVILAPSIDDPALGADKNHNNVFSFMPSDPQGYVCPFAAHIRRANPRDSLAKDAPDVSLKTANRHRMVRRGIPYGERLVTTSVLDVQDDGKPRGLYFIALNTNIKRQFEFVQAQWVDDAQFDGLFNDKDPVVGTNDGSGNMTLQRQFGRRTIPQMPGFLTTKGGGYFFVPSLTSLRFLSGSSH